MTLTAREEALFHEHRPIAISWLTNYATKRLPTVVKADFVADGLCGLMDACRSWDPDREASFPVFAYRRVIGAAIDGIRRVDWVPRSVRRNERRLYMATRAAEQAGDTSDEALAQRLQITVEELGQWRADGHRGALVPFEVHNRDTGDDYTVLDVVADPAPRPDQRTLRAEELAELRDVISRLPVRERFVITQYYWGERTLREIGEQLGVTESRVSQLHTKALERMRPVMRARLAA
jgi:RNA polymerase sigma factor for flagellar operon FliA